MAKDDVGPAAASAARVLELQLELSDLRSGKPSHKHEPRDGSPAFRCTSPYCDDLGSDISSTSPDGREDPAKYRRALNA